jgi:endonuclease/exonuclease/phosphatase family metal-dependent hydrolase
VSPDIWRAVTLNIWNRQGPWPERLPLIREALVALEPDIVGLQEVLGFPGMPSQADEIAAGTGWHVHFAPAWHIGGGLSFGNAILSRHPLRDQAVLPLPTPDGLETRSVAFARVDAPHGPAPVFVTHLTYQQHLGHVRCAQVRALADHVAALSPIATSHSARPHSTPEGSGPRSTPDGSAEVIARSGSAGPRSTPTGAEVAEVIDGPPPVVLGDFNADPDADEIRFMRGLTSLGGTSVYFADCWHATGHTDPGYTYDRKNPYAMRSREPSRRIDYIFVRGPDRYLRGEPLTARLACDEPTNGVWPSDHVAVVADIWAAKRPHDPY